MLAHVRHLAADPRRELAHRGLATGKGLEDAQPLWVTKGPGDGGGPLSLGIPVCVDVDHVRSVSLVAQERKCIRGMI